MIALDPERLFDELGRAKVDYVLVGGFAVSAHGSIRATKDVDICPNPEEGNLRRLAKLLSDLQATVVDIGELQDEHDVEPDLDGLQGGGNFRLMTRLGGLDVMQYLKPFEDETWVQLSKGAEEIRLGQRTLRVCSYVDLLEMKQAAGRNQDLVDIRNLKANRAEL